MSRKNEKFDYEFNLKNRTDYVIMLSYPTTSKLINTIFNKAKAKLAKKKGIDVTQIDNATGELKEIEVPTYYHNIINNFIKKTYKDISRQVGTDGIVLLNENVTACKFKKQTEQIWLISIKIEGCYDDRRK